VAHPEDFVCLSTGNFPPQPLDLLRKSSCSWFVQSSWATAKKKVDKKFVPRKITQLISRQLVRKPGYEAGICHVILLSKASNTGFSRHIKTAVICRCVSLEIALWPNTRVVKCKYCVSEKNDRPSGTMFYSLLNLNSPLVLVRLKYLRPVI